MHFQIIKDYRQENKIAHKLSDIILLTICGVLSGHDGWDGIIDFGNARLDFLKRYGHFEAGIPSADTLSRVMGMINPAALQRSFIAWMKDCHTLTDGEVIAIDGKTLRGSYDRSKGKGTIHMVNAFATANGMSIGQQKVDSKSNEITAIPKLLDLLEVKGCLVTIDAMGCQKDIAEQIVKQKGDYLLALKGNQGNFHEEVVSFLTISKEDNFKNVDHDFHEEVDAGHGRVETRRAYAVDFKKYKKHMPEGIKWKKLTSIIMVETVREGRDFKTFDTRFYISSCDASAKPLLHASRKHWGVENSLHWTLDVTFREDESRIRKDAAPENYAILRHIALNIIRRNTSIDASVKRKRHMAALNDDVRTTLIRGLN